MAWDIQLVMTMYEALARRHPECGTRGRRGAAAEMVLRLLVLKHVRMWSYATLEREVRSNLVFARSRGSAAVRSPKRKPWAGGASAAVIGSLVAAILSSAPLRLRITAHDEQFGDTRADLVGLPCAEGIVAHVNAFNGASWRDLANPNLHLQYETKVRCCVTKVTTCGGRNPLCELWEIRKSKVGASDPEIFAVRGNPRQMLRALRFKHFAFAGLTRWLMRHPLGTVRRLHDHRLALNHRSR